MATTEKKKHVCLVVVAVHAARNATFTTYYGSLSTFRD